MTDATFNAESLLADAEQELPLDGRRAWRERNRLAVVDALLDLYSEGNLRPGATEVAERSGVSRRSVFRYFDDRDDLDRTAIARQQARVRHLLEVRALGEGPLVDRITRLAGQRIALFEQIQWAARVSRLRAPFHATIAAELQQARRFFARQVERHFGPELATMDGADRSETFAAAEALTSFESFDLLIGRGLEPSDVRGAMERGLSALFKARL